MNKWMNYEIYIFKYISKFELLKILVKILVYYFGNFGKQIKIS